LVSNDSLAALHALLRYEPPANEQSGWHSSLEAQLAARLPDRRDRPLTRTRWREARRQAREVAFRAAYPGSSGRAGGALAARWPGRWVPVHRTSLLGKPLPDEERARRQARLLLARWGVVTKACLEREAPAWSWETLYPALAALELRGEARRGYFVEGLPGIQFALPEAVELLRAANGERERQEAAPVVLSAADPAQVYGTDSYGGPLRFARVPSAAVALVHGEPVAVMEEGGANVLAVAEHRALTPALRALGAWWAARSGNRLKVVRWHGEPVQDSPGAALLEAAGFVRDYGAMIWIR
jgi:ATP-dependent Lhr-like helicase